MKVRYVILVVFAVFLILPVNSVSGAVNTREIDRVRNKGVLDSGDFQVIDRFVSDGVQELIGTRDFTSVAKTRTTVLSRSSSNMDSARAQYAQQFSDSARKHITLGLDQASKLSPEEHRFEVVLNFLILIDGLEDLRLADLAIKMLDDENMAVRYWAVHSVTNSAITAQLNSDKTANLSLTKSIIEKLKGLVDNSSPEIISLMVDFSAEVEVAEGEDLLLQIVDMRISRYADWTVDYELLDTAILKLLCDKISLTGMSKSGIVRRFGQLYSYAIQRYIQGRDFLDAEQKQRLVSVLVETEKTCISKLLGMRQSIIKKAIERDDYSGLLQEYDRLFGDGNKAGKLAVELKFDYGKAADGSKLIAPVALPKPPKN